MKAKLITALRLAGHALVKGTTSYNWDNQSACNCGLLVCALTNRSPRQLSQQLQPLIDIITDQDEDAELDWTTIAGYHCPISGFSNLKLFQTLKAAGLTRQDICDLEYLESERVRSRMKYRTREVTKFNWRRLRWITNTIPLAIDYSHPTDVGEYMLAWADVLTEDGHEDTVPQTATEVTA